jgi:AcrR family transcriptional regulator
MADLTQAADTSAGKLSHHFPTKGSLFEAIFESMTANFEVGPLATPANASRPPKERIHGFLDGVYKLYAIQRNTIGCPVGHTAGDADGVSHEAEGAQASPAHHQSHRKGIA